MMHINKVRPGLHSSKMVWFFPVSVTKCNGQTDLHYFQWANRQRHFSDSFTGDTEEGDEYDDPFAGPPDTISLASERYEKDDEGPSDGM